LARGIVGVELRVTSLEGKWKLSQNRPGPDIAGLITGLASRGADSAAVAQAMADSRGGGPD